MCMNRHSQLPDPKSPILPGVGDRIADRFVVEKQLGAGASGAVYQAFDEQRGVLVALKFLTAIDPGAVFRFKSEFRVLANLVHPNLLQLYELLSHGDAWLLTMELIQGSDFLAHLRPQTASSEELQAPADQTLIPGQSEDALVSAVRGMTTTSERPQQYDDRRMRDAFRQLCEGLFALHRAERLHRDLKPGNVLVSSADSRVVICDFGLAVEGVGMAEAFDDEPDDSAGFRATQREIAGTLPYMSPEQAQGQTLTAAADWYSVGVMLYEALTGYLPFARSLSLRPAVQAKLDITPTHPRRIAPALPSDMAELALALLRPNPADRPGYAEAIDVFAGRGAREQSRREPRNRRSFVGRDQEIDALLRAFSDSQNGSPTIALVSGLSGMGKSSLVQHVLAEIEDDARALVLRGRCYEREELPYKALDPLIDALSSHLVQLDAAVAAELLPPTMPFLAALFPALNRATAVAALGPAPEVADPRDRRRLAFRALRDLCRKLSQRRPLVLFIDDLQWGDVDSAQPLQELLASPDPPAVLVVCAYRREDEQRSPLVALLRQTHALDPKALRLLDVPVEALPPAEALRLACDLLPDEPAAKEAAERIAREAEGSPFFVRELVEYVHVHGPQAAGRVRVEALVREKLSALEPDSRQLLSVIAVAGRPIATGTVREVTRMPGMFKALRELERRRLVLATQGGAGEQLECYHDRIREAICQVLPEERRYGLHRDLAVVLECAPVPDSDALLEHWRAAGERDKAGEYALRGAHKAEAALAFRRAAELYREALALLPLADARRRQTQEQLGHALLLAGRGTEAAAEFLALIPGAEPAHALDLRMLATTQLLRSGKLEESFSELERADDLFGLRFPRSEARAFAMLVARKLKIQVAERQLTIADRDRDPVARARLHRLWEVAAAVSSADLLRGGVYGAELMLRAIELGDPTHIAGACGLEAVAAAASGNAARTEKMLELSTTAERKVSDLALLGRVRGMQAICRELAGRWLEAIDLARESQAAHLRKAQLNWDHAIMIWWEMAAASMAGRLHEMSKIPEALRDAETRGDVYMATSFRTYRLSWAWLAMDRPDIADAHVDTAEREWTPQGYQFQHWHMTYSRTEIDLYQGQPARALARLEAEWGRARLVRQVQQVGCEMLFARARLLLASAKHERNASQLRQAAADSRKLSGVGRPWTLALGTLLAACVASFERRADALRLFDRAEGLCRAADMELHAAVCRFRRAELQGTAESGQRALAALEQIRALGAKEPRSFVELLAPVSY
ncbi:MAG TPA: AAA family ATPase [Polyangiales bacterium]|nr:AAA family ATPase [Polyangiales bacterium]